MPSRTLSGQWEAVRPHLDRLRIWLGTPERAHSLLFVLWPIAAIVIAALVLRFVSTAKELADLISAFASLTWPVVILAVVNWFRPEIRAILSRIRKGKFLGQEIELDELQAKAEVADAKAELPAGAMMEANAGLDGSGALSAEVAQDAVEEVLREASRSPRLGLMLLSAKIERAARELAENARLNFPLRPMSLRDLIRALVQVEQLPSEAGEALDLFYRVRNRIIHGHDADDDQIARAIDSGTRLLRLLLSRPRPQAEAETPEEGG
jgi:hypothetical protein